jgi:transmembrane protein TMEM43
MVSFSGNTYTEVSRTGLFGNLGNAIKGVVVGLILFVASFAVLWWNEGRTDMSEVAKLSKPAAADKIDPTLDGQFVSVTGPLQCDAKLADPQYLNPVQAIKLFRNAEMYAWVEKKETREEKEIGGSTKKITTYTYAQEWTGSPPDSSQFKDPDARTKGYVNPPMPVESASWTAEKASVGAYPFDPREASMPSAEPLQLSPDLVHGPQLAAEQGGAATPTGPAPHLEGSYVMLGTGTLSNPRVGDVRISYGVVRAGAKVTIFGKQNGSALEAYVHKTEDRLFRVLPGTREEAIATLALEHKMVGWLLRAVGFFMMWSGLCLFFGPINTVLDILPFLGSVGRTMVSIVMFPIALVLSLVTIVVSKVAHSPVALVVVLVLLIGGGIFWARRRRPQPKAA